MKLETDEYRALGKISQEKSEERSIKQVMRTLPVRFEPIKPRLCNSGSISANRTSGVVGKCVDETGCGRLLISLWECLRVTIRKGQQVPKM